MTGSRRNIRKRGPEPDQAKRDHYPRLMAQGVSNSAACREVGINRRTGTRWRYGRTSTDQNGQTRSYPPTADRRPAGPGSVP
ncbi:MULTISPECIES: hypothetical protein [unclassified Frankia]|uniref:hypothetical protein n=1 Tax=unclassified Frankia TaxID=2632575 RepID=UPI002AD256C8|nr:MULTISPECIES: hypothetical protein [unclassified Frankia]